MATDCGDINARVREVYRQFTPQVEDYSIDESFLWFQDQQNVPTAEIRRLVRSGQESR